MATLLDILIFRRMISPIQLQFLFWGGFGGTLYGSWALYTLQHWAWPVAVIFGVLLVRVVFERAILAFRSYDRLCAIEAGFKPQSASDNK